MFLGQMVRVGNTKNCPRKQKKVRTRWHDGSNFNNSVSTYVKFYVHLDWLEVELQASMRGPVDAGN